MNYIDKKVLGDVQFYVTTKYSCGYINGRDAQSLVATPYKNIKSKNLRNQETIDFLNSKNKTLNDSKACLPIRVLVSSFIASRSQKRVKKYLDKLSVRILPLAFDEEHYDLYVGYQNNRHRNNSEKEDNIADYNDFLIKSNVKSKLIEFWDGDLLKIVSIVDIVSDGISAVYTFYDCSDKKLSLGTISIIWLLDLCKKEKFSFLYLGYWIFESQKMKYKINFKPYELMIKGVWKEATD